MLAWKARIWQVALQRKPLVFKPDTVTADWLKEVVKLSAKDNGPLLVEKALAAAGIHIVFEEHLKPTNRDGVAMRNKDGIVVIGMTLRHNRIDNFWFTLAHELAHVVLHLRDSGSREFIDNLDDAPNGDKDELAANALGSESLIPKMVWDDFVRKGTPTERSVFALARSLGVSPAIPAGRYRWQNKAYALFKDLIGQDQIQCLFF